MGVPWIEIEAQAAELADTGYEVEAGTILRAVERGLPKPQTGQIAARFISAKACGEILAVVARINTSTARAITAAVADNLQRL